MDSETYARLLRYARRILPPDPALEPCDLVQAAWLKTDAARRAEPGRDHTGLLFRALGQVATDHRRRLKTHPVAALEEDWYPDPARFEDAVLDRLLLAPYWLAAATNPHLLAVVLMGLGFDQWATASAMGCKRSTVGTHVWRWRQAERQGFAE